MNYLPVSKESIKQAAEIMRAGRLVAFPTETVYGLGADVYNGEALAKIFEVKERPRFDPLIVHIASIETLEDVADMSLVEKETREKLFALAENLWPGPLSIVLPKNKKIPGLATAGLATAAVRFPDHEAAQQLIKLSTGAIAAPSANRFGSLSPTRAEHVRDTLGDKIDLVLDGGPTRVGLESTVLDITGGTLKILRHGGTTKEAIENLIGRIQDEFVSEDDCNGGMLSPGQLKSHYAPKTPLCVMTQEIITNLIYEKDSAFLFFSAESREKWEKALKPPKSAVFRVLSESGNLIEAASRLFETLHELDKCSLLQIFVEYAPQIGLGEAINDRLRRASS